MIAKAWCIFAAIILVLSLIAHVSTFLGVDPMQVVPPVMLLHVLIFPPFAAAIIYGKKVPTPPGEKAGVEKLMALAPRWMSIMTSLFLAYAVINFVLFMYLTGGGVPEERNGQYRLQSHGHLIRTLTASEYHDQRALVVRGFSGHWMAFSSAALTILVGSIRAQRQEPNQHQ